MAGPVCTVPGEASVTLFAVSRINGFNRLKSMPSLFQKNSAKEYK